jgi:RHS repeat-associated protein
MTLPGRSFVAGKTYRYGFNGKENDKDAGVGIQDYGMRIYDTRLGKFLSVDPLAKSYPWFTPYQFAGNNPIRYIDLDGAEPKDPPLPGMEGMTVHARQRGGPNDGNIQIWTAWKGAWIHGQFSVNVTNSGVPYVDQSFYHGPSTYYDIAEATTGIPAGTQYPNLSIEFFNVFGWSSYIAQPVFNDKNEVSSYVVGGWMPVIDEYGKHNVWRNIMVINRDDIFNMTFSTINHHDFGLRASFKSRLLASQGDLFGSAIQSWKDVNSNPWNWVAGATIYAGGLQPNSPVKGTLITGERKVLYRGGVENEELMVLKEGEFQLKPNSPKYPVRGLSLTADKIKAKGFGGSNALVSVPKGLKVIHTPSNFDTNHFDLIPINPNISQAEYQSLLNKVVTKSIK